MHPYREFNARDSVCKHIQHDGEAQVLYECIIPYSPCRVVCSRNVATAVHDHECCLSLTTGPGLSYYHRACMAIIALTA